jgi:hypothetical protein
VGEERSDDWIVAAALAGDFEPLMGCLSHCIDAADPLTPDTINADSLTPDRCRVLIQILTGEIRRPKKRPPDKGVAARRLFISFEVEYLERHGWATEAAVKAAADQFGVSTRLVYKERKKFPIDDSLYENIMSGRPIGADFDLDLLLLLSNSDDPMTGRWMQHAADLVERHRTSSD